LRLDKFLKVSRLVKRRTVAKEVADSARVMINGRQAKPGSEVVPGDTLDLNFGRRVLQVKILEIRESASTQQARDMYQVVSEVVRQDW
jgi:ribosomal 50S subunit-recycling heat shock protein